MGWLWKRKNLQVFFWLFVSVGVVKAGIACLENPCLHGICIDDINSTYSCYCVDGYTGVQCQTDWDECWSDPCQNGGTCIDGIASFNCSCPDGFTGEYCETNYDECESNPCQNNGTCIDLTNGYVCSCTPGFSGEHCEVDIAVCNSSEEVRCHNGGQCIEGPGFKYYCKCLPGWAGKHCEEPIDECASNPCGNGGICIDIHADYLCACTFGYTGKSCETQIEFCDDRACSNNALCVVEDGARVCYCVPDYHGERCELQYDECLLGPGCMNGGTCIDGVDNFTCSCPPRLSGQFCECLILDSGNYDCEYVSPTLYPETTKSVILSTIYSDHSSTNSQINSSIAYNNTSPITTTILFEFDTTTTPFGETITTPDVSSGSSTEIMTEVVTGGPIPTRDSATEDDIATAETAVVTTTTTDLTNTASSVECGETCIKTSTQGTQKVPKPGDDEPSSTPLTESSEDEVTERETTEISFIPEVDRTTESMFTESPTENPTTGEATLSTSTIGSEITTIFSNTTMSTPKECSDLVCNEHGKCNLTPTGIQCHCLFNYEGKYCDEKRIVVSAAFGGNSFIAHKIRNKTSFNIEFDAKTLITDGEIMFVDNAKGIYMQLFMNSGLLKFKFSCGYQTMLLSELKTFVNKGFLMKIETRLDLDLKNQHCNATLRLNDTVAMSGGQVANISTLDHITVLYLGNNPNLKDHENKPFVGCMRDLKVNGESRDIFGEAFEASEISECSSLSCLSGPCLNGGTCKDNGSSYICSCANGWMGENCHRSICEHNPCHAGASCIRHPGSGFLCLCPYGKHGIFCEYNVEITRPSLAPVTSGMSSFLIYPMSNLAMNSERFDLRFRFQTTDMDQIALLAFVGQNARHDPRSQHLALTFVKGYIMLTWNMGNGPRRIFTPRPLSERRGGHSVRVGRRGRSAWLSVDARFNVTGNAPGNSAKMTTLPYIYIGGHPSEEFEGLPHDLPLHSGWRGCVWDVGGQAVGSGKALGGRGVGQCGVAHCTAKSCNAPRGVCIHSPATYGCICNEGWFGATCAAAANPCDHGTTACRGRCVLAADAPQCDCPYGKTGAYCENELYPSDVLFPGVRSFARLHPRQLSSVSVALEAEVKPRGARGLLLYAETPHFYTALSLQGGLLEYRWTERLSGVTSLVRSGVVVSMGQWHTVKAGRYGSHLYVWVDGTLSTEAMLAHAYPHTVSNAFITLGGAEDLSKLPFDVMSGPLESFTGCIRNLNINNILLPLEKQNIEAGQNLADCDGTACGGETCGGGTCTVEDGRAKCSCGTGPLASDAAGLRCRRHAPCRPAQCAPPRGLCRRGSCVCAAGFAGDGCTKRINITIPQFTGESLLSLGSRSPLGRVGEQRVPALTTKPTYIAFNFTTALPNGLLFWCSMDKDYLGLGLENGYLKLVWMFHPQNTSFETLSEVEPVAEDPRSQAQLLSRAGFLADGEWHVVTLRLGRANVTLSVDRQVVYAEKPGLDEVQYDAVDLFIGGVLDEELYVARTIFPQNFRGCIDDIFTSEEQSTVLNYTEVYSENIKSCQLFP